MPSNIPKEISLGRWQDLFEYAPFYRTFDSGTGGAASGDIQINDADYSAATAIDIHIQNDDVKDQTAILDTFSAGDIIKLTSYDRFKADVLFTIDGPHVDGVIPVTFIYEGSKVPFIPSESIGIQIFKVGAGDVTLNTDTDLTGNSWFLDEDDMVSDDPTKVASQQSIKSFIDSVSAGLFPKMPTRLATTTYLDNVGVGTWTSSGSGEGKTLTAGSVGILTIDSVNSVLGDRIWIKDEDGSSTNLDDIDQGIYEVTTEGTAGVAAILTRATDFDGSVALEVRSGSYADVVEGTQNANTGWWVIAIDPIVVDTDPITIALHRDPGSGSKIIFDEYVIGTTSGPTTTVTTEGTSVDVPEMTSTWTPSSATNKIKARFTSSFSNSGDENVIMAIYVDDIFQPETLVRQYANAGGGGEFNGSVTAFWEGTHAVSPMTVKAKMWTTGGTLTAIGVARNGSVEEIRR